MANTHLTGGCGCGAVKFEIDEPLVGAAYCHCTRCQRRTGSAASVSALMKPGSLRIVQGEDRIKAWTPEGGWAKHFCGECGSALFGGPAEDQHTIVRMGVIDGDPGIRPIARQYVTNAAPWEPIPDDGLHRFDESMPLPDPS